MCSGWFIFEWWCIKIYFDGLDIVCEDFIELIVCDFVDICGFVIYGCNVCNCISGRVI